MRPVARIFLLCCGLTAATPSALYKRGDPTQIPPNTPGVATFNDYKGQGTVDCPSEGPPDSWTTTPFAAAVGDLSPLLSKCSHSGGCGPIPSQGSPQYQQACANQNANKPSCYQRCTPCDACYVVTNTGGAINNGFWNQKPVPAQPQSPILVRIVDSCPSNSPQNFCKDPSIPPKERCMDLNTNSLDIDIHAYTALSGGIDYVAAYAAYQQNKQLGLPPNLQISISYAPGCTLPASSQGQGGSAQQQQQQQQADKSASKKGTKAGSRPPPGKTAGAGKKTARGKKVGKAALARRAARAGFAKREL